MRSMATDISLEYGPYTNFFNQTAAIMAERSKSTTSSFIPGIDGDTQLIGYLKNLFYTARSERRNIVSKWNKHYRDLRSRAQADSNIVPRYGPAGPVPEIFPIVASTVGWMTDQKFQWTVGTSSNPFIPYTEFFDQIAHDLESCMQSSYHVNHEELEITTMLWDAFTYGTGFLKTAWNNTLAGGMGDAKTYRVDPYTLYPDPAGTSFENCNYIFEVRTMSIQEVDRRYPGSSSKLLASPIVENVDRMPSQLNQPQNQIPMANPGPISPNTDMRYGKPGQGQVSIADMYDRSVTLFECWIREHEVYESYITDNEGKKQTEEHVFDTWRCIVFANDIILMDYQAEDIWSHGKHPYTRYVPVDLGEFWGISLVDMLTYPQRIINRLLDAALTNIELVGNPILVEDNKANTQRQSITNRPGQRVNKNAAGQIGWMEPPKMQSDIPELLQYFLQRMEAISGLSAITKGGAPPGRSAQGVMDSLQEAAFVRIRMHLRNLEYALTDAGSKKASLIAENYTSPRMMAIVGPTGSKTTLALDARHFQTPTKAGAMPLEFTLLVDAGSGTDTSRKVREDRAVTLFGLGAIDEYTLLESLDFPNRQAVFARVQQLKAMGMMQPPGARQRAQH